MSAPCTQGCVLLQQSSRTPDCDSRGLKGRPMVQPSQRPLLPCVASWQGAEHSLIDHNGRTH
jgi:hypothetical protein